MEGDWGGAVPAPLRAPAPPPLWCPTPPLLPGLGAQGHRLAHPAIPLLLSEARGAQQQRPVWLRPKSPGLPPTPHLVGQGKGICMGLETNSELADLRGG